MLAHLPNKPTGKFKENEMNNMLKFKKTLLWGALAASAMGGQATSAIAQEAIIKLMQNDTHWLQFRTSVEQVTVSNGEILQATAHRNKIILNTLGSGTTEVSFVVRGESQPRSILISVNGPLEQFELLPLRRTGLRPEGYIRTSQIQQGSRLNSVTFVSTEGAETQLSNLQGDQFAMTSQSFNNSSSFGNSSSFDTQNNPGNTNRLQGGQNIPQGMQQGMQQAPARLEVQRNTQSFNANNQALNNTGRTGNFISFEEVANLALENNPQLRAAWYEFAASEYDVDFARGGYFPVIDLNATYSHDRRNWEPEYDGEESFSGASAGLSLTQSIYDGFRTSNEVKRFESQQLIRYYELVEAVESTTLQAFVAFQDVLRFRELVALSEENLDRHIDVFNQIEQSAQAGVARGADLEQISGRLSLAETNLLTEISNLHDVSARFLRIVGELPALNLVPTSINGQFLPNDVRQGLRMAYQSNPAFHAAIRNVESQNFLADSNRAAFHPQVVLNAGLSTSELDDRGFENRRNDGQVAVQLRYNLFNGGRDKASLNRSYEQINQAKSLRDTACYNLRQDLQIAMNEVSNLDEQLPRLEMHTVSSDRVRTAYKAQFDIGQRTLLDVLDSENEHFQAIRAYTDAIYNRTIASARALSSMGQLLPSLNIVSSGIPTLSELGAQTFEIDAQTACPDFDVNDSILPASALNTNR